MSARAASRDPAVQWTATWRPLLAGELHRRRPDLPAPAVDDAVRCCLTGVVFLRATETCGLEPSGQLDALSDATDVHARLAALLRRVDERYAGGHAVFAGAESDLPDNSLRDMIRSFDAPPTAETLVRVHEQFVAAELHLDDDGAVGCGRRAAAKRHGAYYTPPPLIEHILRQTLPESRTGDTPPPTVLDPACGAGAFLVAAARRVLASSRDMAVRRQILHDCIHGMDTDARAVEIARLALLLLLHEPSGVSGDPLPDLTDNVRCADALIGPDYPAATTVETDRFDVVVGNPPWGQKAIRKDRQRIAYIRQRFPSSCGIFDLFRPFVELAVNVCRPGGRIGLVLPDIVLLKNYEATRRLLLDRVTLLDIGWWGMRFPHAVIDVATIAGIKQPPAAGHRVRVGVHDGRPAAINELLQDDFRANPRCTFNLWLTPARRAVLEQLADWPRLGDYFAVHEGVHSGNLRAELFVGTAVDDSCRPLLLGRDEITPYRLCWHGRYLRRSILVAGVPGRGYANLGRPEWHERKKLLIRRTGDRVLAAVDREARYASNNFFVAFPTAEHPLSLDGLCALLNAPLLTWYFRVVEPRRGRAFAELKIKHLHQFPVPEPQRQADACAELNDVGRRRATVADEAEAGEIDRRIDVAVRELFGVETLPE
ncbi:MAG: TaqI-like C-terminal specificity domain-containing protein [Phycisphaerae bacterium]|jgi:hypothetical protein